MSDCFFKEGNLQFSLADYQQALEIDPTDGAIKGRVAVIYNEYGIQEYQAKVYSVRCYKLRNKSSRTERSNIWRTIKWMWTNNTRNAKIKGGSNKSV